ncbi:MAG: BON domain-containing protein [Wenzhouxiangella sp.]
MNTRKRFGFRLVLGILVLGLLGGCAAMVVGGAAATGAAVHDRRSVGTVVDDNVLRLRVRDALFAHEDFDGNTRIRVLVYEGWVLLAGEVIDERRVELATELALSADGVARVFNELEPMPRVSLSASNGDRWLTTRVNTSLAQIRDLPGFDPSRVKATSTRGVVYLMGLVSQAEAEAATEQVRMVRGVERVVTLFQFIEEQPQPTATRRPG